MIEYLLWLYSAEIRIFHFRLFRQNLMEAEAKQFMSILENCYNIHINNLMQRHNEHIIYTLVIVCEIL